MNRFFLRLIAVSLTPLFLGVDPIWASGVVGTGDFPAVASRTASASTLWNTQALIEPLDGAFVIGRAAAIGVRQSAENLLQWGWSQRRRAATGVVATGLLIPSLGLGQRNKKEKVVVQPPQILKADAVAIERVNVSLTKEQTAEAWLNASGTPTTVTSFDDFLKEVIARNPEINEKFLEDRAQWEQLLSMVHGEGKSLNINSSDTHAAGVTWEGKRDEVRDTAAFVGLTASRPQHRIETLDASPDRRTTGGFWHRLSEGIAHSALAVFQKGIGGLQVYSKNTIEENWLKVHEQAFEVNKAAARLAASALSAYQDGLKTLFGSWIQRQAVNEAEAERHLVDYRAHHEGELALLEGRGPESVELLNQKAEAQRGAVENAKSRLNESFIGIARVTAHRTADLTSSQNALVSIAWPTWTAQSLDQEFSDFDAHIRDVVQAEASSEGQRTEASVFDKSNIAGFPTLKELFATTPPALALGQSPKERTLELQRDLLKAVQIPLLKLREQFHWQVGTKFEFATTPLLLSILNFSIEQPSPSTKMSYEELITAVQLRIEALNEDIAADQINVHTAYLTARAKRLDAFVALQATRREISLLKHKRDLAKQDDTQHTTMQDGTEIDLEIDVLNQKVVHSLAEATLAWKQMELLSAPGQTYIAKTLETHYINTLQKLDATTPVTPGQVLPALPSKPISDRKIGPGGASLFGIITALAVLVGFAPSASAHTFVPQIAASASNVVPTGAAQVAIDVTLSAFNGGPDNTLTGIAVNILQALHPAHAGRFSQSDIWNTVYRIADKNGIAHSPEALAKATKGTLHIGSYAVDVVQRLVPSFGTHANVVPTPVASQLSAAASSVPHPVTAPLAHSISTAAQHVAHAATWSPDLLHGLAFVAGVGLLIAGGLALWRYIRAHPLPSLGNSVAAARRPVAILIGATAAFFAILHWPSSTKAAGFQDAPKAPIVAPAPKPIQSTNVFGGSGENFAVSVTPYRHPVQLPFTEPGVVTYVKPHLTHIAAHQPITALEPLPYGAFVSDVNKQWRDIHPGTRSPLLNPSLLTASHADLKRAPIRIRSLTAEGSIDDKIRRQLFALKELLIQAAYRRATAEKTRGATGRSDLSLPERDFDNLIRAEAARFEALVHQRRLIEIVRAGDHSVDIVDGSQIAVKTPVNGAGQPASVLFTEESKSIVGLGLSPDDALLVASGVGGLKFSDATGQTYFIPSIKGALTIPGNIGRRDASGPPSRYSAFDSNATFGAPGSATARVEFELAKATLPKKALTLHDGVFSSATSPEPIQHALRPGTILGSVRLIAPPSATVLRHDAFAPAIREQLAAVNNAATDNQRLLNDVNTRLPSDSPYLLELKQKLDLRQMDLQSTALSLKDRLAALEIGESSAKTDRQSAEGRVVLPTHPIASDDASAIDNVFPKNTEADQRTVWRTGDVVHIQVRGDARREALLDGSRYSVYLPSIDKALPFALIGTENADRKFPAVQLLLQGDFVLGNDLSLKELLKLFNGMPSESALTFGEIQLKPVAMYPLESMWDRLTSWIPAWAQQLIHGRVSLPAGIVAWTSCSWDALLLGLSTIGLLIGAIVLKDRWKQNVREESSTQARPEVIPAPDEEGLIRRVFQTLPGKLKDERATLNKSIRDTPLRSVRGWVEQLEKKVGNRSFQHLVGILWVYFMFIQPLLNVVLRSAFFLGIENQTMISPLVWQAPVSSASIRLVIFVFTSLFISIFQRSGEVWTVVPMALIHFALRWIDNLIVVPILWAARPFGYKQKAHDKGRELDGEFRGVLVDLARVGRFFLRKIDSDPVLSRQLLKAFEEYNQAQPAKHRLGSGPLEIVSAEEAQQRLSSGSLSPEVLETARAKFTIERTLSRNSLSVRGLLALISSGLVIDAFPPLNTDLGYSVSEAIEAFVASGIYPKVSANYRRAENKFKSDSLRRAA